ncbi:tetratricopeptide repeat protein [Pseudomonas simiae]|uniref:tetratricopeptide repeat protein n=1 Tax=Pseudomonas simiae TaxID=321846 RepID=UPI0010BF8881|nr:tetratricopeptide repeat protein [Pseudomonas simiae]MBD8741463.1 tetratricopeptide repeat protein [Pseudomonas fluorescens]MBC3962216.1 tetratricopeptide repeat protein [Pseudomonas simiae]TKK07996.1 biofilm formation protein PelB [Pseudomonas fluorescens]UNK66760.1 tetratricopeptide repeat protein [Pseudomonas simiae]WLG34444.1 tetratricopeptide repeat protein [Pseudomonas simiae]
MVNSSATKSSRLLNPWALAVVAVAVGGLLWATFQREEVFQPDGREPDAVSANYAELLLTAHPDDDHLRLQLVDLLIRLGDYTKARQHVDAWPKPQPELQAYYRLELDALIAAGGNDLIVQQALVERLQSFDHRKLPVAQLESLAKLALTLQAPAFAATVFEEIAGRDPAQRTDALKSAAQWYLAGEQPARAADIYLQLKRDAQQPGERREYAQLAFNSLLSAGRDEQAAQVLADELPQLKNPQTDVAWLEQGVDVAVATKQFELAQRVLQQWHDLEPDNRKILVKEFHVRLSINDLAGAWETGQELVIDYPDDSELLEQMAKLGEWRGDNEAALDYWIHLLKLKEDPKIREHAWRLASLQFDFARSIPLLAEIMQQRPLTDIELDALIYGHESRGTPAEAESWLRTYLRKYPGHRLAWTRLLQNLENTGQFAAKGKLYKDYANRYKLTTAELVDWASTEMKLFDEQAAWEVVKSDDASIDDPEYWHTRAALAWGLERDEDLRVSLEKLLSLKGKLTSGDESQLITLYRTSDPQRALKLMVDSWHRAQDPQRLVEALQLAQELQEWDQVVALLEDAKKYPEAYEQAQVLAVRGALAAEQGDATEAERLYLLGLSRYPDDNLFRERLTWLYVDQADTAKLKPLLTKWRANARHDRLLWLPFASASQLLGRDAEALAWYRLYLKLSPNDWLVQAAYADALETSGYQDAAQRLRLKLLRSPEAENLQPSSQRYAIWLRLMSSSYSPQKAQQALLKWKDGSPSMKQLWFERLLARLDATNQQAQKDDWLAWARTQGLKVDRYEQIQEALRSRNKAQVEILLASSDLNPAQRAQALSRLGRTNEALETSLSALGDDQPDSVNEQLRRQAVEIHEATPQGALLSYQKQDFGGLSFDSPRLEIAHNLGDNWYADVEMEHGNYKGDDVISSRIGDESNAALTLVRSVENGSWKLFADTSQRKDDDRNGLGLSRMWQLGDSHQIETGLDWHRKSDDSGLMRAFGQQDRAWVGGRHGLTARDQLSWEVAQRSFSTRTDKSLGNGHALKLELNHTLEFAGPNWTVRSGVDYQKNNVKDRNLDYLSSDFNGPIRVPDVAPPEPGDPIELQTIASGDLLQSRYGQLYVGTSWRRGIPGALVRSKPQYTWLVDMTAGWQWTDQTFNYGINTGIGFEVLGDDELALTFGYQSAPQGGDGKSGGTLGMSYGVRFGR